MELGDLLLKERSALRDLSILVFQRITRGGSSPLQVLDGVDLIAQAFLSARQRTFTELEPAQVLAEIRV